MMRTAPMTVSALAGLRTTSGHDVTFRVLVLQIPPITLLKLLENKLSVFAYLPL